MTKKHPCHSKEIGRINRAVGQLEGIKKMISDGRYCVDILHQVKAAKSAIKSIEANILATHLESCIKDAFESKNQADIDMRINEIKDVFKKNQNDY
jgi:DNA-binding FrmR family transcriptional regulator